MTDAPDLLAELAPTEETPASAPSPSLEFDVAMVLVECHRDRKGDGVFRHDLSHQRLEQFAAMVAHRLAPRIGGRYVPRRCERDRIAERDSAVLSAFNGRNHQQVMRDFRISRRLLYNIIARRRLVPKA